MSSFSSFFQENLPEISERTRDLKKAVSDTIKSEFGSDQDNLATRYQQQQRQRSTTASHGASSAESLSSTTTLKQFFKNESIAEDLRGGLPASSFTGRSPQVRLPSSSSPTTQRTPGAATDSPLQQEHPQRAPVSSSKLGGAQQQQHSLPANGSGRPATPPSVNYATRAAEMQVTPLYLAVLSQDHHALARMLGQGSRVNPNQRVDASGVTNWGSVRMARLPRRPETALELAVAMGDKAAVDLLMDQGAVLQVPRQLSLEELRRKAKEKQQQQQQHAAHGPARSFSGSSAGGGGVRRGGQLASFEEDCPAVFCAEFLDDPEVQRTLGWQDFEAQLLTHTLPSIVERILKRQGYQLTLSMSANPHELAALFENAVAGGNAYVVQAMVDKGVKLDAPTFRRGQYPLCVAINTLQPAMVSKLLSMGASLHNERVAAPSPVSPSSPSPAGASPSPSPSSFSSPVGGLDHRCALFEPAPGGVQRWYPLPDACLMLANVAAADGWPDLAAVPVPQDERFGLAARCIEVLVDGGAQAPEGLVPLLGRGSPLADAPPVARHGYCELLRILLRQREWSPQHHACFPFEFKRQALATALCSRGGGGGTPAGTPAGTAAAAVGGAGGAGLVHCGGSRGSSLLGKVPAIIEEVDEEGEGEEEEEGEEEGEERRQERLQGGDGSSGGSVGAGGVAAGKLAGAFSGLSVGGDRTTNAGGLDVAAAAEASPQQQQGAVNSAAAATTVVGRRVDVGLAERQEAGEEEQEDEEAAARRILSHASPEALQRVRAMVYPLSRWLEPCPPLEQL